MPQAQKVEREASADIFNLQQQWLLACADFDHAKGKGAKQRTAVNKMQKVLRLLQGSHPRELAPYKAAYEKLLEKMAGVRLPRSTDAQKHHEPSAPRRKREATPPRRKKTAAKKRR